MTEKKMQTRNGVTLNMPFACSIVALLLSLSGIFIALNGYYDQSFGAILLAVWFDMIDGALSRKLKLESVFGGTFDLLQDMVNYIVYPIVLFYLLSFNSWWAVALLMIYAVFGTTRLARFHAIGFSNGNGKLAYLGMPVYFNHLICLGILLLSQNVQSLFLTIALPVSSILMVSSIRFPKPCNFILWSLVLIGSGVFFLLR